MDTYEKRALSFANRIRRKLGLDPVSKLERGELGNECSCPITNTLHVDLGEDYVIETGACYVFMTRRGSIDIGDVMKVPTSMGARKFIERFDEGRYPLLIETQP